MNETPFTTDALLRLPRLSGLSLSPDGRRLVTSVARRDAGGKKFASALYEIDPEGHTPPQRLTHSAAGESGGSFAPDGSLLFISARPDPDAAPSDDPGADKPALWRLPAGGGEARLLVNPPGGVGVVAVAGENEAIAFTAGSYPDAAGWQEDAEKEKRRKEADVGAQLFTGYPIRFWDRYLGPRERRLYHARLPEGEEPAVGVKDLTPSPGNSIELLATFDLTPDGETVVAGRWNDTLDPLEQRLDLVAIAAGTGEARPLSDDGAWYSSPSCSPDGAHAVAVRAGNSTPEEVADNTLWLVDLSTGTGRDLLPGFDLWPEGPVWSPDSGAVFFTAEEDGNVPVFRVDLLDGGVTRLCGEGAFGALCPTPDGRKLYALRSGITAPPHPVALDARAADTEPRRLASFKELDDLRLPASLERVTASATDGTPVRSWLLLPPRASAGDPASLATFIHGGPLSSWSGWHWRWNPHVFVAAGWAVLLPDPALSTGYGLSAIQRGWGRWGDVVYGDLMSAVDGAVEREDVDRGRTVAMGGSFGGYMANWIAGHTNRFSALVTHASLWNLESFHGTTDLGAWWEREFGNPYLDGSRYRENSPHRHVADIETPMLVIHGEQDYRVPISEALSLWTDLRRHGVPAEFLYFPDENHWIIKPNNASLWYETVLNFINHHARGEQRSRPDLL